MNQVDILVTVGFVCSAIAVVVASHGGAAATKGVIRKQISEGLAWKPRSSGYEAYIEMDRRNRVK